MSVRRSNRVKTPNTSIFNKDYFTSDKSGGMSDLDEQTGEVESDQEVSTEQQDAAVFDVDIPDDDAFEAEMLRLEAEAEASRQTLAKQLEREERIKSYRDKKAECEKLEMEVAAVKARLMAKPKKVSSTNTRVTRVCSKGELGTPSRKSLPSSAASSRSDTTRTSGVKQNGGQSTSTKISDIRKTKNIREMVTNKLSSLSAHFEDSSDSDEGDDVVSGKCYYRKGKGGKHTVSEEGPLFPNDVLGPQHAVKAGKRHVDYQDLNMRLLCLGEFLIAGSGALTPEEIEGRSNWVANLLIYAKSYKFSAILLLHEEMIVQVFNGQRTWSSDHSSLVAQIVIPHPLGQDDMKSAKNDRPSANRNFTYFCSKFNSTEGCPELDRHMMVFKGESVTAHHICATCLLSDKKQRNHARGSDSCPNKKQ